MNENKKQTHMKHKNAQRPTAHENNLNPINNDRTQNQNNNKANDMQELNGTLKKIIDQMGNMVNLIT